MPVFQGGVSASCSNGSQCCTFDWFQERQEKNIKILHTHWWCHMHLHCTCKAFVPAGIQRFQAPRIASIPMILVPDFVYKMLGELHTEEIHSAKQCLKLRNLSAAVQAVSWIIGLIASFEPLKDPPQSPPGVLHRCCSLETDKWCNLGFILRMSKLMGNWLVWV